MTRRRKTRAPKIVTVDRPWSAAFVTVFRLASDAWTPPATVRVRYGARSWTLKAVFVMEDGAPVELTTRVGLGRDGRPASLQAEPMTMSFGVRGGGR